ncbi:MAG: hypothetical protein QG671_575 [Actinomycetota bacterium]|nr:hypothetical protein [Actinomycetota bacterium]
MGSWLEELERRERAAMERIEVLRQRIAELTDLVAAEEDLLSRLGITREMMMQVLSGIDPAEGGVLLDSVSPGPVASSDAAGDIGGRPTAGGVGVKVPVWREGIDAAVLPLAYRDIVEVLADFGRPVRAKAIASGLGLGQEAASVETLRSKLKRLVARGWAGEPSPGLFTVDVRVLAAGRTPQP